MKVKAGPIGKKKGIHRRGRDEYAPNPLYTCVEMWKWNTSLCIINIFCSLSVKHQKKWYNNKQQSLRKRPSPAPIVLTPGSQVSQPLTLIENKCLWCINHQTELRQTPLLFMFSFIHALLSPIPPSLLSLLFLASSPTPPSPHLLPYSYSSSCFLSSHSTESYFLSNRQICSIPWGNIPMPPEPQRKKSTFLGLRSVSLCDIKVTLGGKN